MSKEVILTGIRANNDLHIGNYFGALLPMVDMAKRKSDEYEINLFIPDLHSFTTPIDHSKLQAQILHNLKIFVAAGLPLDNPSIHIYRQSHISAHSELAVILSNFARFSEIYRMTQFKDKSRNESLVGSELIMRRFAKKYVNGSSLEKRIERIQEVTKLDGLKEDYTEFLEKQKKDAEPVLRIYNSYRRSDTYNKRYSKEFEKIYINDADETLKAIQKIGDLNELKSSYSYHLRNIGPVGHMMYRAYQDETPRNDKNTDGDQGVSVGLFTYPILMASDILLYGGKYVPVGADQTQHLEFTRDLAERMNRDFGDLFVIPESVSAQHKFFGKDQGLRIKDLVNPTKKMSKSDESDRGIIFMGDEPEQAASKIMNATTDSKGYINRDSEKQPGITNLIQIYELLGENPDDFFVGSNEYGSFKNAVSEKMEEFIAIFQRKLNEVDELSIKRKLESDEKAMTKVANSTLLKVQKAVGLRPKN